MPSLSQCVITGTVYDVNGDPVAAGFRVAIQKTVKSGQVIQWIPEPSFTTSGGAISLTAPRSSTIYVYAKTVGLMENGFAGVALSVPNAATANLEDLISVTTVPSTGITVKDDGTAFASLVGTLNFVGSGVAAVETSAGLATITITSGSGVTLREVDGSPSLTASTVEFLQTSGFVVTDQTGGVGRVDLLAIPVNKLAALTASRVPVTDGSGFLSASSVTSTTLGFLDATSSIQTQLNARALESGGTIVGLTSLGIRSTGAAFDLTLASSEVLTAGRTLSFVLGDAARTLTIGGSASVSGTNTGDQTSVSGNAGTATALATPRAIYGNNFDGTVALTQIIASTFGGTGNGFTKFSGPTTSEKTFTLPDATATILTSNAAVTVAQGGTGVATLAANGVLYGNATGVALVTTQGVANSILTANAGAPSFSQTPIIQTSLQLGVVSSATGGLKLANSASAHLTTIQAGNAAAARTYTWPTNFGAAGTVLTDAAGDGTLSWAAGGGGITVGTTTITSGANTKVLFNNSGVVGEYTVTGSTNVVMSASPTLTGTVGLAALTASGTIVQTSASATAFESGPNGGTNPVFRLVNSVASAATGLSVTGNASGSGVTLTALGGTNENINLIYKGTGTIGIGGGTVSFPALWNSSGTLAIVTGTNSAFAPLTASVIIASDSFKSPLNDCAFYAGATNIWYVTNAGKTTFQKVALSSVKLWSAAGSEGTNDTGINRNAVSATEINNGTAGQWGSLLVGTRDAGTTTVTNGLTLGHQSTGTPAAGLGSAVLFNINSSTTADQNAGQYAVLWTDATHATRTADHVFSNVLSAAALAETFRIKANGLLVQPTTTTAGGTTGAQTINKPTGSVNFAAGASTLVVTNSLVSATTLIFCTVMTADTTSQIKNVVAGAGSFTITLVANATAETKVVFWCLNT